MSDLKAELRDKVTCIIASGISEDAVSRLTKVVRDIMCEVEDDIMYRLKDDLAPNLSAFVLDMAEKSIVSLLEGNEDAMRGYLSCRENHWNGRSEGYWQKQDISRTHPVIHGVLFETGCLKLRHDIVNAHRDLLVNERIKDLEDQNASLVAQINEANAARDAMWERVRN